MIIMVACSLVLFSLCISGKTEVIISKHKKFPNHLLFSIGPSDFP
ncbi:unnamed protein product [Tuber melanosporum]|uniref:(Perigord truffle) hypothetical protein n=1 Tax=Tuber melanosporum (strain Mel28) TaxID=656061 RepID=D5GJ14_TUBMM|nr:uncharacterized protein GSTUM_00008774001 [Tuber melanosporum]CAZ84507.1 unnamed protein product [Tuber melanosporum]